MVHMNLSGSVATGVRFDQICGILYLTLFPLGDLKYIVIKRSLKRMKPSTLEIRPAA